MMIRTLAVVAGLVTAGALSGQELPLELAALAESLGCEPVPGFFERPGMIDPPFLYGIRPGPREQSAAFWCATQGRSEQANRFMA